MPYPNLTEAGVRRYRTWDSVVTPVKMFSHSISFIWYMYTRKVALLRELIAYSTARTNLPGAFGSTENLAK